jgi:large subunit ribosomal protein L30e
MVSKIKLIFINIIISMVKKTGA